MYHCYSPERLEKKAEEILNNYMNGALLLKPQAMDVDHFAEFYCKATIDFAYLSEDGQTLGLTCFQDGKLIVWNETRTQPKAIDVGKGWILLTKMSLNLKSKAVYASPSSTNVRTISYILASTIRSWGARTHALNAPSTTSRAGRKIALDGR